MKLCLLLLLLLSVSYALADAMPQDSSQFALTRALAAQTRATTSGQCPPVENLEGVQAVCQNYEGFNQLLYMQQLDEVLFTASAYPDTLPGLRNLRLEPRTPYWIYLPEYGRFERSFDFEGGIYRIIFVPFSELSSNLTILYTPALRPSI